MILLGLITSFVFLRFVVFVINVFHGMDSLEQLPNLRHSISTKVSQLEKLVNNEDESVSLDDVVLCVSCNTD